MHDIAISAGFGAMALEFIREDRQRLAAFEVWAKENSDLPWPRGTDFSRACEGAAIACAGLNQAFKDAA